ncbi:Os08g0396100, partial [Oryza sativa Japonica Group]
PPVSQRNREGELQLSSSLSSSLPAARKKDAATHRRDIANTKYFPFRILIFMPNKFPFDTISFHPLQRRERHRAHGSSRARPERRRHDLVAVPASVERIRSSRRANIFPSRSSPNALKNPQDLSTEERDRAILLQLRPPSSIFDSSFSGELQVDSMHFLGPL